MLLLKKLGLEKTFPFSTDLGTVLSLLWRFRMLHETRAVFLSGQNLGFFLHLSKQRGGYVCWEGIYKGHEFP